MMIPSSWIRITILALFILEVAGALMWLAAELVSPAGHAVAQTVAGIVLLLGFYAGAPLSARFLAPYSSRNDAMQGRLTRVKDSMPETRPVFLYDHAARNAITVGLLTSHSRIYVTSGLMERVSDEGLKGILAHEDTHVRERHILATFGYACAYAFMSHLTESPRVY
jgi:heat shock protein HtpX